MLRWLPGTMRYYKAMTYMLWFTVTMVVCTLCASLAHWTTMRCAGRAQRAAATSSSVSKRSLYEAELDQITMRSLQDNDRAPTNAHELSTMYCDHSKHPRRRRIR